MAVYGYVRVSHEDSKKSGLSVGAQKDAITRYCERRELDSPQWFIDEAVSAWKIQFYRRPQGGKLREIMKAGDTIIFYRLDRGFRSLLDFVRTVPVWIDEGVNVVILDQNFDFTTANGKLFLNVMAAYAQWKSDMISQRTKAGLERRKLGVSKPKRAKFKWQGSSAVRASTSKVRNLSTLPQRVFSYGRVSHINSMEGMSLDAQRQAIDDYVEWNLEGVPRCAHFEDHAVSAYSNPLVERPSGAKLDSELREGDHVVFARLDRVWRSTLDMAKTWEDWKKRGITVHFADTSLDSSTASGEALMELLAVFAKWESADSSERVKAALDRAKREGRAVNRESPIGFETVVRGTSKVFAPNTTQIRDAWMVNHLRNRHGMTVHQTAEHMEKIVAYRENRKPFPICGVSYLKIPKYFGVKSMKDVPKSILKSMATSSVDKSIYLPTWTVDRIKKFRVCNKWAELTKNLEALRATTPSPQ
jgi:DNA invertase Pin-like site-specific DNA recombinase